MTNHIDDILAPLNPLDPRECAGYRLVARLGEGGMGTVYLSHTRGGQPVAFKVIRREYGQDPDFRRRFEQEVRAARRVQGYHLVPVVDHDTSGELPWIASEFVPGLSLADALAAHGPLPLPAVLQLVGCTAKALGSIHAADVVHRDLKPANVLLSSTGPYVIDFGIAQAADATQLTRSGGVIGTPQYMSPEHALGEPVGAAGDVFALGLIAAVAATGRHPYGEGGATALGVRIANTDRTPPDLSGYPAALRTVLERCLTADPTDRIGTDELARLCEQAAERPLRAFDGWLPAPLAERIAHREAAAAHPPTPTRPDTAAHLAGQPTVTAPPRPRAAPTPPPAAAAPPASGRTRPALLAAAAVAAVALAVVVTWTLARPDAGADDDPQAGPTGGSAKPTATDDPTGAPSDAPSDPASPRQPTYTAVFKDKPLTLRAPAWNSGTHVDLDAPKVFPDGEIGEDEGMELTYQDWSDHDLRFLTPVGRSAGRTPEACRTGVDTDTLPAAVPGAQLEKGTTLTEGTVLCTVTSDNNLAMLRITEVVPSTDEGLSSDMPDYVTSLTLWQISE
ncbi:serine/threonine-protein kinase [Streptomyces cavernicola]|uniref:non-specific serine/threonine protein kinase n=1 Tax=Streptomyces cavernicola TaxID=3043613 RepID=A0ABT6SDY8_9ACTN|nr:serine/threonine-protein kinase [Streptomyces sp. B-S-A6]MDI3406185.1 serine/threonine-protein kinase [Streptomyces sp. B-S-A6]